MKQNLLILLTAAVAALAVRVLAQGLLRRRTIQRMDGAMADPAGGRRPAAGRVAEWLSQAGYRDPSAALLFLAATAGGLAAGLLMALVLEYGPVRAWVALAVEELPGGAGDVMRGLVGVAPWVLIPGAGVTPWLLVRAARRRRVAAIERDLSITLELLATLAEAGLGFDAALARIQDAETVTTPLEQEFGIYQRDVLAGLPRAQALRQMAKRVDVTTVTVFVSAITQADQLGANLAETLRVQANDLRDRRRMQALVQAQALPVKLVFPLILCFLPGLFVSTLGPALLQLVKFVDGALRIAR